MRDSATETTPLLPDWIADVDCWHFCNENYLYDIDMCVCYCFEDHLYDIDTCVYVTVLQFLSGQKQHWSGVLLIVIWNM